MQLIGYQLEPKQVVRLIMADRKIKNRELAIMLGIKEQNLSSMISPNGARPLTNDTLLDISRLLNVPFDVLLTGEGVEAYLTSPEALDKPNGEVSKEPAVPHRTRHPDLYDLEGVSLHVLGIPEEIAVFVPYVSRAATASYIENATNENHRVLEVYPVITNIAITSRHIVFQVSGDSMEPTIVDGSRILCQRIQKDSIRYLNGGVYVVLFSDQLVVKRIQNNSLPKDNTLTLDSDNALHGSLVVLGDDIRGMWQVLEVYQKVK